jgi:hypothetical protein
VEQAIKGMRDKKATRDDDVPGDIMRLLGEGGPSLLTQLIKKYETDEWPKNFI